MMEDVICCMSSPPPPPNPPPPKRPPLVAERMIGQDLGLPVLESHPDEGEPTGESDGLDWPLRLSVLWQMAAATPFRRTQSGEFFKRDPPASE